MALADFFEYQIRWKYLLLRINSKQLTIFEELTVSKPEHTAL